MEASQMSDVFQIAQQMARELVGESVWIKLSETIRANAIEEEMRVLNTLPIASGPYGNPARDVSTPGECVPKPGAPWL
jgi:hypothetical protein